VSRACLIPRYARSLPRLTEITYEPAPCLYGLRHGLRSGTRERTLATCQVKVKFTPSFMIARFARAKARLQAAFHFGPSPATSAAVAAWSPRSGARNCSLRRKRSGDDRQDDPPVLSVRDLGTSRCKSDGHAREFPNSNKSVASLGPPNKGEWPGCDTESGVERLVQDWWGRGGQLYATLDNGCMR
jgi:hypothetical protein